MKNKKSAIIWVVLIFILGIIVYQYRGYIGFNANTLNLSSQKLELNNFRVYSGFVYHDENPMNLKKKGSIIFDGNRKYVIQNDYGENDILITYKDSLYCIFRHFKTHSNRRDIYNIRITGTEADLKIKVEILGTDPTQFQKKFEPVLGN